MGKLILCNGITAKKPFYIKNSAISVYNIEELCYYLCHNLFYLEEEIKSERLCSWIEMELQMNHLAAALRKINQSEGGDSLFVSTILRSISYCDEKELKEIEHIISEVSNKSEDEKQKIKADQMVKIGKIKEAIAVYKNIVKEDKIEISKEFVSKIFHNIGSCYTKLFLFQEAEEYYWKSYEISKSEITLYSYFLVLEHSKNLNRLGELLRDNYYRTIYEEYSKDKRAKSKEGIKTTKQEALEEILTTRKEGKVNEYYSLLGSYLESLKTEYRKNIS